MDFDSGAGDNNASTSRPSPDSPPDPRPWPGGVIGVNSKALRRNVAKRGRFFRRPLTTRNDLDSSQESASTPLCGRSPPRRFSRATCSPSHEVSATASSSALQPHDRSPPKNNICVKGSHGGVRTCTCIQRTPLFHVLSLLASCTIMHFI